MTAKEDRPCCVAKRDELGRLQPGFCGPECIGRLERDAWFAAHAEAS